MFIMAHEVFYIQQVAYFPIFKLKTPLSEKYPGEIQTGIVHKADVTVP
jgi:hypothetical protein